MVMNIESDETGDTSDAMRRHRNADTLWDECNATSSHFSDSPTPDTLLTTQPITAPAANGARRPMRRSYSPRSAIAPDDRSDRNRRQSNPIQSNPKRNKQTLLMRIGTISTQKDRERQMGRTEAANGERTREQ